MAKPSVSKYREPETMFCSQEEELHIGLPLEVVIFRPKSFLSSVFIQVHVNTTYVATAPNAGTDHPVHADCILNPRYLIGYL